MAVLFSVVSPEATLVDGWRKDLAGYEWTKVSGEVAVTLLNCLTRFKK